MNLVSRSVQLSDADDLLSWRNSDHDWRLQLSRRLISADEHLSWLTSRIQKIEELPFKLYSDQTTRLAFVRAEQFKNGFSLSIAVNPMCRGMGIGSFVLKDFQFELLQIFPNRPLYAIIHKENIASVSVFKKSGYIFHGDIDSDFVEFMYVGLAR